jgi:F0F1-type ATP synthase membrane subunit b/b'
MLIATLILFQLIIFAALVIVLKRVLTKNIISATGHLDEMNQDYLNA